MDRRTFLQAGIAAGAALQTNVHGGTKLEGVAVTPSVMLWTLKGSFEQKLEVAAAAGCRSVELVGEHAAWSDADIDRMKKLARSMKLGMDTLIATPDWGKRPVSMVLPEQRDNFLADVKQSITFAQKLEIPQIILMSGNQAAGKDARRAICEFTGGRKTRRRSRGQG